MSRPKQYHILYVDDEAENLLVLKSTFRREYKIFTALSAADALQILARETIHLVISDQKMAVVDGVSFLREVSRLYPDVIRLILTGYGDLETVVAAVNECGIYRYLTKPWQEEDLKLTLEKALETYRLRDENQQLLDRLAVANQHLEARVAQRTAELVTLNEEKIFHPGPGKPAVQRPQVLLHRQPGARAAAHRRGVAVRGSAGRGAGPFGRRPRPGVRQIPAAFGAAHGRGNVLGAGPFHREEVRGTDARQGVVRKRKRRHVHRAIAAGGNNHRRA